MNEEDTDGVYIIDNNTFYYLDSGPIWRGSKNAIDILRTTLIARGLLSFGDIDEPVQRPNYKIMKLKDARRDKITISVVYLNKHIEGLKKKEADIPIADIWD